MSWTDERVELLKKLWMDGLSASQIAGELGGGVTRNAVIGKVHRLKLSGRAKPANSAPRARPASRPAPRRMGAGTGGRGGGSASGAGQSKPRASVISAPMVGATALKADEDMAAEYAVEAVRAIEIEAPEPERLTLLELSEQTCKWPIGDPLNADFHFCGRQSNEAKPYCEFHSRRAYHQIERKKRS